MKKATKKVVSKKTPVKKTVSYKQEYIITKPTTWGFMKKTFNVGDIITHDSEANTVSFKGETFTNSQDFAIMIAVLNRAPEKATMKVYNKNSAEAQTLIANALKIQGQKKKGDFTMLPVEKSDQDLINEINIEHTQIGKIDQKKKEADRKRIEDQKGTKMTVIKDTSRNISDIVASQTKSIKMPVVKDDGALVGTGNAVGTLKKASGRPVVQPPKKKAV
jgi:hypothetical protein